MPPRNIFIEDASLVEAERILHIYTLWWRSCTLYLSRAYIKFNIRSDLSYARWIYKQFKTEMTASVQGNESKHMLKKVKKNAI